MPFMAYVDVKDNDGGLQNVLKKPRRIASGGVPAVPVMAPASEGVPQVAASNAAPWEYNG